MAGPDVERYLEEALPFFEKLSPQSRDLFLRSVSRRHYQKGQALHSGPNNCMGLFLLESGQVRTYLISDSGREITLFRLFERDVCLFSASCVMKNISFDVYIDAEADTDAILIPTSVYLALSETEIAFSDYINQLMSSRFSDVMWVMEQVLFMSFDKRLAIFLLEQSAIDGSDDIRLTHEAIAKHIGSAREVVTRMLKYFQTEGMVELSRGGIRLLDVKRLSALAG